MKANNIIDGIANSLTDKPSGSFVPTYGYRTVPGQDPRAPGADNTTIKPHKEKYITGYEYVASQTQRKTNGGGPMGPLKAGTPWISVAMGEYGQEESFGETHNQRILEYFGAVTNISATTDETAWCSAFVNWTLAQVGITGTSHAKANSFWNWGVALDQPAYGAIGVYKGQHVGFLVGESNGKAHLLGGNQGNKVNINYSMNMSNFTWVYPAGYQPSYVVPPIPLPH